MAVDTNNNIFFMWPHNANKDGSLTFENYLERVKKKSLAKGGSGELRAAFDNDPRLINSRGSVMYATGMPNIVSRELFYMKTRRNFIGWNKERFYLASVGRSDLEEFRGIIKNMGLQYAINVDAGGSTALYANGKYLHGPGRNIVNAVLIVPR